MAVIPTRPAPDHGSARTVELRVARRASGTSVDGPGFHVWDPHHETAMRWARELARGLPLRRSRPSPPSTER